MNQSIKNSYSASFQLFSIDVTSTTSTMFSCGPTSIPIDSVLLHTSELLLYLVYFFIKQSVSSRAFTELSVEQSASLRAFITLFVK